MNRCTIKALAPLLAGLVVFAGCYTSQPFYLRDTGDLSYYLDKATEREFPDVQTAPLPDAAGSESPLTLTDPEFRDMWDLSLEEAITISLQNAKVIRGGAAPPNISATENGKRITPVLSGSESIQITVQGGATGVPTTYNVAVQESNPGSFLTPEQIRAGVGSVANANLASQQGVEAALSEFDAQFTTSAFWNHTDRPPNAAGAIGTGFASTRAWNTPFRAELSKKSATGTHLFFAHTVDYERNDQAVAPIGFRALPSIWTAAFEVGARQPLLRGNGTQVNRAPILISRTQTDKSLASLERNLHNFIANIEVQYWELGFAFRALEARKVGRDSALSTWKIEKERLDKGATNAQQEAQAREQYFFFRNQVQTALCFLYEQEARLRLLLGIATSDGRLIRPVDEATPAWVDFGWEEIRGEALDRRPVLRQAKWDIKQRELEMILARNRLLPTLNATALYRWLGRGDELLAANRNGVNFPGASSRAFETLTDGNFQEFTFGGELAFPVGFRRELAGVRHQQLLLAQSQAVLEDIELTVVHDLASVVRVLDGTYSLAETDFNRWVATMNELEVFQAQRKQGTITLDIELEAQRRRVTAQEGYYRNLSTYNQAIAMLHYHKGSIADFNSVIFTEGPWPEKASYDATGHARRRGASIPLNYGYTRPNVLSQGEVSDGFGNFGTPYGGGPSATPAGAGAELLPTPMTDGGAPGNGGATPDAGSTPFNSTSVRRTSRAVAAAATREEPVVSASETRAGNVASLPAKDSRPVAVRSIADDAASNSTRPAVVNSLRPAAGGASSRRDTNAREIMPAGFDAPPSSAPSSGGWQTKK